MITKNPESKPIIKVSNWPGSASAFFNSNSFAPDAFILSDTCSNTAHAATKVSAQIAA